MEQLVRELSFHSRPVSLAHELNFPLESSTDSPSRPRIECGDRSERVEPRVMQVGLGARETIGEERARSYSSDLA